MPEVIIFTGLQASGKSTYYKEHLFQSHLRVSLDLLRTRNREKKLIEYCLETEMSFVVDNTNPSRKDRERYFDLITGIPQFEITGYYFQSKIDECIHRNSVRAESDKIPDIGIRNTYSRLEVPELTEGFGSLWYIRILEHNRFEIEPWSDEI